MSYVIRVQQMLMEFGVRGVLLVSDVQATNVYTLRPETYYL